MVWTSELPKEAVLRRESSDDASVSRLGMTSQNAWVPTAAIEGVSQSPPPSSTFAGVPSVPLEASDAV